MSVSSDVVVGGICAWAVCSAVVYSIFTWAIGCYTDDDDVYKAVLTVLGPVGLALLVLIGFSYGYFFILAKSVEKSVKCWHKFIDALV